MGRAWGRGCANLVGSKNSNRVLLRHRLYIIRINHKVVAVHIGPFTTHTAQSPNNYHHKKQTKQRMPRWKPPFICGVP